MMKVEQIARADITNRYQISTDLLTEGAIQSLKLEVRDHQVRYLKAGRGPSVVLLHGIASDSRDWLRTIAALSSCRCLYAPDLTGYGPDGEDNSGYYLSDLVEFTLGFIQTLGVGPHVLVGHSVGGRVCLEIALRHPELVRRLVLVDTLGFSRLARWGSFLISAIWGVAKILRRPQPHPRLLKKDGQDKDWLCLEELPALKVPTLIVWSRHDPYFPLSGALRAKELMPEARLEILPGYGHAPHLQKRDLFNSLLLSFIDHD
jgi:pimeloyl-ACP methyl ester carboxylesterase